MPSTRKNPPVANTVVTIVKACIAAGESQNVGDVVTVSSADANLLVGLGRAIRGEAPKPAVKKPGRPRKLSDE